MKQKLVDVIKKSNPFATKLYTRPNTFIRKAIITGAAAGDFTVPGLKKGDRLVSVVYRLTAAGNLVDMTADFGPEALSSSKKRGNGAIITIDGQINNTGGTTSAAGQLEVMWESYGQ